MVDRQTGSWWQQLTGKAIQGKLSGTALKLIPVDYAPPLRPSLHRPAADEFRAVISSRDIFPWPFSLLSLASKLTLLFSHLEDARLSLSLP
ncbi:DUF3179 domain-containing protein [Acidobacteria bacterium AH-259-D05]|nr:DUF3179 domain-containing protein [Acidobacteria bacterium AH-259-D05]